MTTTKKVKLTSWEFLKFIYSSVNLKNTAIFEALKDSSTIILGLDQRH